MSGYRFSIENGAQNLNELMPLYRVHYSEMQARRNAAGENLPDFNPRIEAYCSAWNSGHLVNYVIRIGGAAVGYSNVYVTTDMHNQEMIAKEDTIFVLPSHRNGTGRALVKFILADLRARGVQRVYISPVTDLRVAKIWQRMGFKSLAEIMTYTFKDA